MVGGGAFLCRDLCSEFCCLYLAFHFFINSDGNPTIAGNDRSHNTVSPLESRSIGCLLMAAYVFLSPRSRYGVRQTQIPTHLRHHLALPAAIPNPDRDKLLWNYRAAGSRLTQARKAGFVLPSVFTFSRVVLNCLQIQWVQELFLLCSNFSILNSKSLWVSILPLCCKIVRILPPGHLFFCEYISTVFIIFCL